ncbi:hypothetical protein ACM66B_007057 [Microbotryomycetes sp. NB124-2]
MRLDALAEHGPRRTYKYTTSEPLDVPKVVSLADDSNRHVWTKTRKLAGTEVVDFVSDSSGQTRWTIHRPVQGWYLALRNPRMPSDAFVALEPVKKQPRTALSFTVESAVDLPEEQTTTPLATPDGSVRVGMDGSRSHNEVAPNSEEENPVAALSCPLTRCHFRLEQGLPAKRAGHYAWSLSTVKKLLGGTSNSWTCAWEDQRDIEVMRFEEHTSLLSTTTEGNLTLNVDLITATGLEPSFWAALALAYIEFLEDKQAYEASVSDD